MATRSEWIQGVFLFLLSLLSIALIGWMFYIGQNIPYSEQNTLYDLLRNVAGTMFAVFGLWIALLYPDLRKKVFSRGAKLPLTSTESDGKKETDEKQADHLLQPFFMSLFILLITIVVNVLAPLVKRVEIFITYSSFIRGASYSLIGLLAICQILSILRAMRITDGLKSVISRARGEQKIKNRIRQNRE